jgi:hypothetical protein
MLSFAKPFAKKLVCGFSAEWADASPAVQGARVKVGPLSSVELPFPEGHATAAEPAPSPSQHLDEEKGIRMRKYRDRVQSYFGPSVRSNEIYMGYQL